MAITIGEIAKALGAEVFGNTDLVIESLSEPSIAGPNQLALAMSPRYAEGLAGGQARAAVLGPGMDWADYALEAALVVPRPRYALAGLTAALDPGPEIAPGIHPTAVIDASASIGIGAAIGPLVVIGRNVVVGARARISSHVSIAEGAHVGDDVLLMQGVRVGSRVHIGDRVIVHPGAVIGSDGMSFVTPEKSTVEQVRESVGQAEAVKQSWTRIHSLGSVRVGDDVEIGANTCIDKGTIRDTVIGDGCKFDNLVHIAHNVQVGRDCLFAGQTGIAGSTVIGERVVFGGQVGVADNLVIGDDVIGGGASKILSNVPSGRAVLGYPAVKMESHVDSYKALRRLPRLAKTVAELQKAVSKLAGSD